MSQRLQRYLSVQKAKGEPPNPLLLAKMLREDVSARPTQAAEDTVDTPAQAAQSIAEKRRQMISPPGDISPLGESPIGEDVSNDPIGIPGLSESLGGSMGTPSALGFVGKGAAKTGINALVANQMGVPMAKALSMTAVSSFTGPLTVATTLAKLGMSSVNAGVIAHSITSAFGEEAAQEAANVISGQVALESISQKGQNAYANAKVAAEMAPTNPISFVKGLVKETTAPPITSTVTPHHTNKAISQAFGVSGYVDTSGMGGSLHGMNPSVNVDTSGIGGSLPGGIDTSGIGGSLHGGGGDGGSGGIGSGGGGDSGIGPGNR